MSINEIAEKNHGILFPNHNSTLKITDPELIEIFDNFAFDEVLSKNKRAFNTFRDFIFGWM